MSLWRCRQTVEKPEQGNKKNEIFRKQCKIEKAGKSLKGCNRIMIFQFLGACCKIFSVPAIGRISGKRELRFRVNKKGTFSPRAEKLNWEEVLRGSWVHLQQRI